MSRNYTPDETLIDRLLLDDAQAFEVLHQRYCFYLYSYCISKHNTPEDAKRIVSRIFIDLWENRHTLPVRFSISMHLYRCVRQAVVQNLHDKLQGANDWPALDQEVIPGFQVTNLQQARQPVKPITNGSTQYAESPVKNGRHEQPSWNQYLRSTKQWGQNLNLKSLKYAFQRVLHLW